MLDPAIDPGADDCAEKRYDYNRRSITDLCKKRPGTGTRKRPTKSKQKATIYVALVKLFIRDRYSFSLNCFEF